MGSPDLVDNIIDGLIHPRRRIGTSRGFRIYRTDPFEKCFERTDGNIALLEMLFSTSLVALVLSPRRLQIKNTKVGVGAHPLRPASP